MEKRYHIYFAGDLLDGYEHSAVRANLARLFKADDATLDKLFSGTPRLVKKSCNRETALKYKQAMEKAGARPLIKADSDSAPPPLEKDAPETASSAAEKIAALAAAPDTGQHHKPIAAEAGNEGSLDLCPEKTAVLREDERAAPIVTEVDTSALTVEDAGQRLSEEAPDTAISPDTSHLSMGEVGESIPGLPAQQAAEREIPDSLSLDPEGSDFSDCASPEAAPPELDLSAINLAPAGTAVLTDDERNEEPSAATPATEHIHLSE